MPLREVKRKGAADPESRADELIAQEIASRPMTDKSRRILIESLEREGFTITADHPRTERASAKLDVRIKPGSTVRLGCVSDTHIGSKYQQITALTDFYRYADSRGVSEYLHAGDIVEGLHVHRGAVYEQYAHGGKAQAAECVAQYPRSANGRTRFIEGNHDAWYTENSGIDVSDLITAKRPDLQYLGYYSAFVELGPIRFLLQHGAKGGGPYGKSYKPQRLLEQLEPVERERTHVALYGHWHTDLYLGSYQGLFGFSLPCFKAQDRFGRTLGRAPVIGGLILEIEFTRDMSIWNLRQEWRYYAPRLNDYPGAR